MPSNFSTPDFSLLAGSRPLSIREATEFLVEDSLKGNSQDSRRRWKMQDRLQKAIKSGHLPATDIFPGREDILFSDHWHITPADLEAWYRAEICQQKSQEVAPQNQPPCAPHPALNPFELDGFLKPVYSKYVEVTGTAPTAVRLINFVANKTKEFSLVKTVDTRKPKRSITLKSETVLTQKAIENWLYRKRKKYE